MSADLYYKMAQHQQQQQYVTYGQDMDSEAGADYGASMPPQEGNNFFPHHFAEEEEEGEEEEEELEDVESLMGIQVYQAPPLVEGEGAEPPETSEAEKTYSVTYDLKPFGMEPFDVRANPEGNFESFQDPLEAPYLGFDLPSVHLEPIAMREWIEETRGQLEKLMHYEEGTRKAEELYRKTVKENQDRLKSLVSGLEISYGFEAEPEKSMGWMKRGGEEGWEGLPTAAKTTATDKTSVRYKQFMQKVNEERNRFKEAKKALDKFHAEMITKFNVHHEKWETRLNAELADWNKKHQAKVREHNWNKNKKHGIRALKKLEGWYLKREWKWLRAVRQPFFSWNEETGDLRALEKLNYWWSTLSWSFTVLIAAFLAGYFLLWTGKSITTDFGSFENLHFGDFLDNRGRIIPNAITRYREIDPAQDVVYEYSVVLEDEGKTELRTKSLSQWLLSPGKERPCETLEPHHVQNGSFVMDWFSGHSPRVSTRGLARALQESERCVCAHHFGVNAFIVKPEGGEVMFQPVLTSATDTPEERGEFILKDKLQRGVQQPVKLEAPFGIKVRYFNADGETVERRFGRKVSKCLVSCGYYCGHRDFREYWEK